MFIWDADYLQSTWEPSGGKLGCSSKQGSPVNLGHGEEEKPWDTYDASFLFSVSN